MKHSERTIEIPSLLYFVLEHQQDFFLRVHRF